MNKTGKEANKRGVKINETKTKYIISSRGVTTHISSINIEKNKFDKVITLNTWDM